MVVTLSQLRADLAVALSRMYGAEVPAYRTLVEVTEEVNAEVLAERGEAAELFGSAARVGAERHGAIRVGSMNEMRAVARLFAAFGMEPVGFYDLRDAMPTPVPVVSTAFRPVDRTALAYNPFRVFTSVLTTGDRRFFDAELQRRVDAFIARRTLFPPDLLTLADRVAVDGGCESEDAAQLVERTRACFELSTAPVDRGWYRELSAVSPVAADIGGVDSTHLNHLTPRVLDIDRLYQRMSARRIEMIDEVQGPPRLGTDVLLRQTSFRALDEQRQFRDADGSVHPGTLRVRFGEVEARGVALTHAGREVYERAMAAPDRVAAFAELMPDTVDGLARAGLAYVRVTARSGDLPPHPGPADPSVTDLMDGGSVDVEPIVYEDFLPRSAAGIFQSNLTETDTDITDTGGPTSETLNGEGTSVDSLDALAGALERKVHDPFHLAAAEQQESIDQATRRVGPGTHS